MTYNVFGGTLTLLNSIPKIYFLQECPAWSNCE